MRETRSPWTRWVRRAGAVLVAAVAIAPPSLAGDDAPPPRPTMEERAKALTGFPANLAALAQWCDDAHLPVERNRVAEAMLLFSPDDEKARGWLGFRSQGEGKWKRVPGPLPMDADKTALPEWETRRDALILPLRGGMLGMRSAPSPQAGGYRDRVLRALVMLSPDDKGLRAFDGEQFAAGKWILNETAATPAGRRRIADAVRDAKSSTSKLKPEYVREPDWVATLKLPGLTVHSAYAKSATEDLAFGILRAQDLLGRALGTKVTPPADLQVYVFADFWTHKRFLETRSDLTPERRKRCEGLGNYWIGDGVLVANEYEAPDRLDGIVRQAINDAQTGLGRMYRASDWMGEGFGMYLTYALVGTRLTVFTTDTKYADDALWREVADARSDWVALVRRMIDGGFDPKVPIVVGTPLNSMSKEDGLVAYALAAYFLESRPFDAANLIRRTQDGTNFHQALAEVCGLDAEGLGVRFVRWLRETK